MQLFLSYSCNHLSFFFYSRFTSSIACCVFMTLVPNFSFNRHIVFALGGALEIATYVFLYFILSRYGRRLSMSAYQSITGAICILLAAVIILSNPTTAIGMYICLNNILFYFSTLVHF